MVWGVGGCVKGSMMGEKRQGRIFQEGVDDSGWIERVWPQT